jgi:transposase-like protein
VSQGSEGSERGRRRQFTAEEKLRILHEADACTRPGELSALLKREGLYSSHLASWRAARRRGELAGLMPRVRGPKAKADDPIDRKMTELERETRRLQARLERIERLIHGSGERGPTQAVATPPRVTRTRDDDGR